LRKSAAAGANRIAYRLIFQMPRAHANWPEKAIEFGNGRVDILINNAGIYLSGPTHEMSNSADLLTLSRRSSILLPRV